MWLSKRLPWTRKARARAALIAAAVQQDAERLAAYERIRRLAR
ncbi:hypothetical protein [Krasilnikovia sp. MM14-A1259]